MSTNPDILTVLLAQTGDRDALDRLFRSVQEPLFHRVSAIVGHQDTADDVLQDVFVLLQRKIKHLRDPVHFRAWAMRIAAREAVHRATKDRRAASMAVREEVLVTVPAVGALEPMRSLAAAEIVELIRRLPSGSRAVLTLHYLDDLPLKEIADVLRIPVGTVKSRLSYGLTALRRQLDVDSTQTSSRTRSNHE